MISLYSHYQAKGINTFQQVVVIFHRGGMAMWIQILSVGKNKKLKSDTS